MTSLFCCRIASTTLSCQRQGVCPKTCVVSIRSFSSEGRGPGNFPAIRTGGNKKICISNTTFGTEQNVADFIYKRFVQAVLKRVERIRLRSFKYDTWFRNCPDTMYYM